jgi:hypothetical protein
MGREPHRKLSIDLASQHPALCLHQDYFDYCCTYRSICTWPGQFKCGQFRGVCLLSQASANNPKAIRGVCRRAQAVGGAREMTEYFLCAYLLVSLVLVWRHGGRDWPAAHSFCSPAKQNRRAASHDAIGTALSLWRLQPHYATFTDLSH